MQVVHNVSRRHDSTSRTCRAHREATPDAKVLNIASPAGEAARLAAVSRYTALDTASEATFNRLAAIAGDLLCAPIALVTLVGDRRLWFKAHIGLNSTAMPRDFSFCRHTILRPNEIMVVPDTLDDPRFSANPMVTGGPHVRFYAGAPLCTHDGHALGTLCVASPEARPGGLSTKEERQLRALATSVMDALELRRLALAAERAAEDAQAHRAQAERLRLSLEVAGACAWELDPSTGVTIWDASAQALLGVPASAGLEDALTYYVRATDRAKVLAAVASALDPAGSGTYATEHRSLSDADGGCAAHPAGARWHQSLGQASFEGEGVARRAVRLVCFTVDITASHAAAEQQDLLVAELNHRVKNTLSIVQSIAEQTRRSSEGAPGGYQRPRGAPERRKFHADFQARLRALATAHDALTRETWRRASLGDLVRDLVAPYACGTAATLPANSSSERIGVAGPSIWLAPNTAVALALVVHELATNAAKHGALSSPEGHVSVSWGVDASTAAVWLSWAETGGPPVPRPPARSGFGSRLIEGTVRGQLGGSLAWSWEAGGLAFKLEVPAARALA